MPKFRKKPVEIEAWQLPAKGEAPDPNLVRFLTSTDRAISSGRDGCLEIETLEGTMVASPGDWVIKGVNGEFYPCKPDIFAKTYEAI